MRQFLLIIAIIPMAFLATAASAQQQPGQDACARDVSRHCRKVMNDGDQAVLACLKQNRSKISKGCEKVLTDHGQ
jgi:Cysteine rich repeat